MFTDDYLICRSFIEPSFTYQSPKFERIFTYVFAREFIFYLVNTIRRHVINHENLMGYIQSYNCNQ